MLVDELGSDCLDFLCHHFTGTLFHRGNDISRRHKDGRSAWYGTYQLGIPIDSGMGLSIRIDKLRVFINKTLSTQSLINQLLIKRVVLSISVDSR